MGSIRGRLLLGALLGVAALTSASGWLLYRGVAADLRGQQRQALIERGRALGSLIEQEGDQLAFEWLDPEEPIDPDAIPRWFRVRTPAGRVLIHAEGWPAPPGDDWRPAAEPSARRVTLPDGRGACSLTMPVRPRGEVGGPPPLALQLEIAEPTAAIDRALQRLLWAIALVGCLAMALAALGSSWLIASAVAPLAELQRQIEALQADDLERRVKVPGAPAELVPVVDQLNALLDRLADAIRREQAFTADAAHELRTPLAGLHAKLELALMRERTVDQHVGFARDSLAICQGMESLVRRMLALARLEAEAQPCQQETLDAAAALRASWQPLQAPADGRELEISWRTRLPPQLTLDAGALRTVATNLLENAVSHADTGGQLLVEAEHDGAALQVRISNSGCVLEPAQLAEAFRPFWRGDPARGQAGHHAGLGLAICRRAARAAGGDVEVSIDGERFVAELTLPAIAP